MDVGAWTIVPFNTPALRKLSTGMYLVQELWFFCGSATPWEGGGENGEVSTYVPVRALLKLSSSQSVFRCAPLTWQTATKPIGTLPSVRFFKFARMMERFPSNNAPCSSLAL